MSHRDSTAVPQLSREPGAWPAFPAAGWDTTGQTLHRWTQIIGKIRLTLSPPQNHFWHSTMYVSARGLTTSPIPYGAENFEIEFDFIDHRLLIRTSLGNGHDIALEPKSVAEFYSEVMSAIHSLGIDVSINTRPNEIPDPIRFEQDRIHAAYDRETAHAWWRLLMQTDHVFKQFRGRFLGKSSPVHFFWGGFDLAVTRFSGRRAPMWDGPVLNVHPHVMHESYSHEVSSAGFWPGNAEMPPLFYSYAVPQPAGFDKAVVGPRGATFSDKLGEFVLPYETVRASERPAEALYEFLQTTYAAAADLGGWDRPLLEEKPQCLCDVQGQPYPRS